MTKKVTNLREINKVPNVKSLNTSNRPIVKATSDKTLSKRVGNIKGNTKDNTNNTTSKAKSNTVSTKIGKSNCKDTITRPNSLSKGTSIGKVTVKNTNKDRPKLYTAKTKVIKKSTK
jgi:hypothetical protein